MSRVIAVVAPWTRGALRGPELVARQRELARLALARAAQSAGARLGALAKDERDAPLPSNGWHWSLSHCATHVAACVHRARVGIDVENRSDVHPDVVERVISPAERALFAPRSENAFLRAWTAKEAVLKEFGVGIVALERCVLVEAPSAAELVVTFDGERRRVWQRVEPDWVLAVSSADGAEVECTYAEEPFERAGERR